LNPETGLEFVDAIVDAAHMSVILVGGCGGDHNSGQPWLRIAPATKALILEPRRCHGNGSGRIDWTM